MPVHTVHKYQFYRIPFTFINSLSNYELFDVLFAVSCAEILYMSATNVSPQILLIGNLEILKLLKSVTVSNIKMCYEDCKYI